MVYVKVMKVSKSQYYAYMFLKSLKESDRVSLPDISDRFDIPLDFLYKVAAKLRNAGIIESKEGVSGGYRLKKDPDSLSWYDVDISLNTSNGRGCTCRNEGTCVKRDMCASIDVIEENISEKLKEIKLL